VKAQTVLRPTNNLQISKEEYIEFFVGLALLIIGVIVYRRSELIAWTIYVVGYLIAGQRTIFLAIEEVFKRNFLDENVMIVVATITAFAIGAAAQTLGIMLIYNMLKMFALLLTRFCRRRVEGLIHPLPTRVRYSFHGEEAMQAIDNIKLDDVVIVRKGEDVPLDGRIVSGRGTVTLYRDLLGPLTYEVSEGQEIISPATLREGELYIKVLKTKDDANAFQVISQLEKARATLPKEYTRDIKGAQHFTLLVIAVAAVLLLIYAAVFGDYQRGVYLFVIVLGVSNTWAFRMSVLRSHSLQLVNQASMGGFSIEALQQMLSKRKASFALFEAQIKEMGTTSALTAKRLTRLNASLSIGSKLLIIILAFFGQITLWGAAFWDMIVRILCLLMPLLFLKLPKETQPSEE